MTMTLATGNDGGRKLRSRGAFTLIELSVVVFILMIITALSLPAFARAYRSSLLGSAGRSLATMSQLARLEAVLNQQMVTLHIDVGENKFWVARQDTSDGAADDFMVVKLIKIEPPVAIISAAVGDDQETTQGTVEVRFFPNGTCERATVILRGAEKGDGLDLELDPITTRAKVTAVKL
jgi:Tfp pilus assembly protein FimT